MPREPLNLPDEPPPPTTARLIAPRRQRGPTPTVNSENFPIEQLDPLSEDDERGGDVVRVDRMPDADHLAELQFMEEPVTIRIIPSGAENAPTAFPFWVNGKGAEVFQRGRWEEVTYLPVGRELTIKRKVLELVIRQKVTNVRTPASMSAEGEHPDNTVTRTTSAVCMFDLIEDRNPRGVAWLAEMRRRNF